MRIGIDARMMGEGYGIGRYISQLVKHLEHAGGNHQYVLFTNNTNIETYKHINKSSFEIMEINVPWYSWQEQLKMPGIIKKAKVDLMHFPHWNVPIFYSDPFVLTIHDLIMFHYSRPQATTLGPIKFFIKDQVHRLVLKLAAKRAKHILVTSEFTKHDVAKTLGVDKNKMTTTYQAPFVVKEQETRDKEQVLKKYNIDKPYVLYVGSAYPHKNLPNLLGAWQIFCEKYGEDYQLVLVGKKDVFWKKQELKIKNKESIIFTGFVPDKELSVFYQNADLYVFPSFYEGFGLPPLEAMLHGVPVVSSSNSCLPEVLGEAVLYFDPNHQSQIAEVIYKGLTDENIRRTLRLASKKELKRYSWQKLAEQTRDIYEKNI